MTAQERINATLARADFWATPRGLVATADLRVFAPMPAKPVSLPKPMPERRAEQ